MRLSLLLAFTTTVTQAASTATAPGSEYFSVNSIEMIADLNIDDTSGGGISSLEQFYDFNEDSEGVLAGDVTFNGGFGSAGISVSNSVDGPTIQSESLSQGSYVPSDPDEIQVSAFTSVDFEIEYTDGGEGVEVETSAIICLMPIRLSLTDGGEGSGASNPQSASYAYSLEIDGSEVYSSSIGLSRTATGSLQLSALEGVLRYDGVFFQNGNTRGFDFPAISIQTSMGFFEDGSALEGRITFSTTTVAPNINWGAYAGAQDLNDNQNTFVPKIGAPIPEPQSGLFLLSALLLLKLRRKR